MLCYNKVCYKETVMFLFIYKKVKTRQIIKAVSTSEITLTGQYETFALSQNMEILRYCTAFTELWSKCILRFIGAARLD